MSFLARLPGKVLELVDDEAIARCRCEGDFLLAQMRSLQKAVSECDRRCTWPGTNDRNRVAAATAKEAGFLLNHLADRQLLGPLISSFLLNEHQIRVAPTLSDSFTLRVQPSIFVQRQQLEQAVDAFADVCVKIDANDVVGLATVSRQRDAGHRSHSDAFHRHFRLSLSERLFIKATKRRRSNRQSTTSRGVGVSFDRRVRSGHMDTALERLTAKEKSAFLDRWSSLCRTGRDG